MLEIIDCSHFGSECVDYRPSLLPKMTIGEFLALAVQGRVKFFPRADPSHVDCLMYQAVMEWVKTDNWSWITEAAVLHLWETGYLRLRE